MLATWVTLTFFVGWIIMHHWVLTLYVCAWGSRILIASLNRQHLWTDSFLCLQGASMKSTRKSASMDAYLRQAFSAVTRMLGTRWIRKNIRRALEVHIANMFIMFKFLQISTAHPHPVKENVLMKDNRFLSIKSVRSTCLQGKTHWKGRMHLQL